MFSNWKT